MRHITAALLLAGTAALPSHQAAAQFNPIAPIVGGKRKRRHHGFGNRQPVRRRVHLLLGQIELARTDVLVRVELDLLEPDHARRDVDLALRSQADLKVGLYVF